jgi:RNA-directed DNA polymerase
LLRVDLRDFFPSLRAGDVRIHLEAHAASLPTGWDDRDTERFVQFVCKDEQLTIGSVTSPALSNTLCFDLDQRLSGLCYGHGVRYTRYADDLYFSTDRENLLFELERSVQRTIETLPCPSGLRVNRRKTLHTSRKHRRVVTGLVLPSEGRGDVSIGRRKKRFVRGMIHRRAELSERQRAYLRGYLAHCRSVEPEFYNRLVLKYGAEVVEEVARAESRTPSP